VAPDVKYISFGSALIRLAIYFLDFSTASSVSHPKEWVLECGLPY